jgi:hypothetical protein
MIDNSELIAPFMPAENDEDTFCYTELLDRRIKAGTSNRTRLVRTYYHQSRQAFEEHLPEMRLLCVTLGVRAYTRLSPRSFAAVGKLCAQIKLQRVIEERYWLLRHAYASACGKVAPLRKLWLYDVDLETDETRHLGVWLAEQGLLRATIPTRKGLHYITDPHDPRRVQDLIAHGHGPAVALHRDSPTCLFIADGAA